MKNNPYIGPRPFERHHRDRFFGREREGRELQALIVAEREVLFYAQSGAGKSSLINARIIPGLEEEGYTVLPVARVGNELPPGIDPSTVKNIFVFSALLSLAGEKADPQALAGMTLLEWLLEPCQAELPILVFDQFEEIFTTHRERWQEAEGFFRQMREALDAYPNLGVVFAMREDYLASIDSYVMHFGRRLRARFRMELLGTSGALAAVKQPARKAGCAFAPGVAEKLVDNLRQIKVQKLASSASDGTEPGVAGPYVEPVQLQVVCNRLWENLPEQDDGEIEWADVEQHGDIDRALTGFYESAIAAALAQAKQAATGQGLTENTVRRWFGEQLITPMETRGLVMRGPETTAALPNPVVDALEGQHIIRADLRAGARWYELSHDRLIQPVRRNNDQWFEQNLTLLQRQAALWSQQGRSDGLLLRDREFQDAENETKSLTLTRDERDFLEACKKSQAQIRLRRQAMIGLISFSLVTLGLLFFALAQLNLSRAQKLAFQAQNAFSEKNFNTAWLYAYQSSLIHENDAADRILGLLPYEHLTMGEILQGHTNLVNSVAWSADGRLASGSADMSVILWDIKSGQPAQTLKGHTSFVYSVAWSADGRLASGSEDGTVIIWDIESGQPAQTLTGVSQVISVAWSADGRLASGSADGTVIIWDLESGKSVQTLIGHTKIVNGVVWSADGRLASRSVDGTVILWDIESGKPVQTLKGNTDYGYGIAWSADGQLASVAGGNNVIIWDLESGQPVKTLEGHTSYIYGIAWSADGQLASGSEDGSLIIWDIKSGQPAQILKGHTNSVNSVAWSADGQLASGSGDNTVMLWDLESERSAQTLEGHTDYVNSVAWSADGRLASGSSDGTVNIWDIESWQSAQTLKGHTDSVNSVAWSSDGRLASGAADGTVIIWDLERGKPAKTLEGHTKAVNSVAWSADGRLASGSAGGPVFIWDIERGKPAQILARHTDSVSSVAWSADGRLASGAEDGTVIIWDIEGRQPVQTLRLQMQSPINFVSVAWSADGRLASGSWDNTVTIWDLQAGQPAQTLVGHKYDVNSIAWSADGRLASGAEDGTVIIWDIERGKPAQILEGHKYDVNSVAWSVAGRLASGSRDATIKIAQADMLFGGGNPCDKLFRNMTLQEWLDYQGALYVYEPACPNLPGAVRFPTIKEWRDWLVEDATVNNLKYMPVRFLQLSWPGRILGLSLALLGLAILSLLLKLGGRWVFRKVRGKVKKADHIVGTGSVI